MAQQSEDSVKFDQPMPRRRNQRYNWSKIADDLRANPGEWGVVLDVVKVSTVNALRQGSVRILAPELGFEVQTRRNVREPIRTCQLWMRYNPDADDQVKSAIRQAREK